MNNEDRRFQKYNNLMADIRSMVSSKGRGYNVAQKLNDEMWEELGTHEKRMQEQVEKLKRSSSEEVLQNELRSADSIYEATKNYLTKFN